ncbi:MAG: hypothetical protein CVV52_03890 [Spirochaetae bacterium HGW-Spirochaetae-8]|jgi:DNA-binding FadR family transcriptional regulator|nr:MAG: hypothetical protein CVV52_03890 [Spirochaetae bacterium HGW-Spirochaetae-8]
MEHVTPVDTISRTEHIAKELERIILNGEMQEDDRLPTQNELAQQFNVGSRTVREALKKLETKGLIYIQQGKGIFVKKKNFDFYLESIASTISSELPRDKKVLLDLTKTREIIELFAISEYMHHPSSDIVNQLEAIIQHMEKEKNNGSQKNYRNLDIQFHQTLVCCTNNQILISFYRHLTNLMLFSTSKTERPESFQGLKEHKELIIALKNMDASRAPSLIKEHLEHTNETIRSL